MLEKLKYHKENKKYAQIHRKVASNVIEKSSGYVLDISDNFVLLQETGDFKAIGYIIFPIQHITKLRYNNADRYYDKIMHWEKEIDHIKVKYSISIDNWQSIFESLQKEELSVIVECEDPTISSFTIGPINKIGKDSVHINDFDALGFFDEEPTRIDYSTISKVQFDDRYINIFSKYTRHKKLKI